MKYIGKEIIRIGDYEFIADKCELPISQDLWAQLLSCATKKQLECVMKEQLECENYEAVSEIEKAISTRFG